VKVMILGDQRSTLPSNWTKETVLAILGEAKLDASSGAGPGASLTFVGLGGDLVLRVPPGSRINDGGLSLAGGRKITVSPGDGPEIKVGVYGLFTDVEITDRPA
jgi:hypothetical protein